MPYHRTSSRALVPVALLGATLLAGCETADPRPMHAGDEPVGEAEQAVVTCGKEVGEYVYGLDVSKWQGSVDWEAVAGAGYTFVITRTNHGSYIDEYFDANWSGIKAAGMIRGAYQYFEPALDVQEQAQTMIDMIGPLGPGDLPPVIDVEEADATVTPAEYAQAVGEWIQLVEEATGRKPIIYTGRYFWQGNVATDAFADYPLWHAQYPSSSCKPPNNPPADVCGCPNIADQWTDWAMWQFTSSGVVPGITVNTVDVNVWNGTYDELVALASGGSYGAAVVDVAAPATVLAGEAFGAVVTVANTGGKAWDASTFLGTTEPRDRPSAFAAPSWVNDHRAAAVVGAVAPGESYTFNVELVAPAEPGAYVEHFGLVQEGVAWFADQAGPVDTAITLGIQVVEAPPSGSASNGTGTGGAGGSDPGAGGAGGDDADDADTTTVSCSCEAAGGDRRTAGAWAVAMLGLALVWRKRR
jgi:lysozyme